MHSNTIPHPHQEEIIIETNRERFLLSHKEILKHIRSNMQQLEDAYHDRVRENHGDSFSIFLDDYLTMEFAEDYLRAREFISLL